VSAACDCVCDLLRQAVAAHRDLLFFSSLSVLSTQGIKRSDSLGHEGRQVIIVEREYEELVGVVQAADACREVVVIRQEQRVFGHAVEDHIWAKRQAFQLRRDVGGRDPFGIQLGDHVKEEPLTHRLHRQVAAQCGHVRGASEVNLEQSLHFCTGPIAQAFAITFIQEKFVMGVVLILSMFSRGNPDRLSQRA
jgi:hypothetical protein